MSDQAKQINNWIGGQHVAPKSGSYQPVRTPVAGEVVAQVALSNREDVDHAVACAKVAFQKWSEITIKARVQILLKIWGKMTEQPVLEELSKLIMAEHGKNKAEALAEIAKGLETLEYACSLPQLISGRIQEVSRGVYCQERRDPMGIVVSIVPFNFPCMVPFWTVPIALAAGNCMILKPSEKVPMTMSRIAEIFKECGLPDGVFQIVNGTRDAVEGLIDHPDVRAVTFVGSTPIAEIVAKRARALNKRCLALGGAKNHLVVAADRHLDMASSDIVASFTGCTGQRCMAASAALVLGHQPDLLVEIVKKAAALRPGQGSGEIGPVIDQIAVDRIMKYIDEAEKGGAQILLDGRTWVKARNANVAEMLQKGYWVGPTVILHKNRDDAALQEEIFGPVISILEVSSKEEAIELQRRSPFGNAASIYTSSGAIADWFTKRFSAGMLGVNIGVPVPREPFSFGGLNRSKFGDMDITGDGGIEFFTERRKITTKWTPPEEKNWMN